MLPVNIKTALEREPVARVSPFIVVTAAKTLTMLQSGSVISNQGATGSVTVSLPTNCVGKKGITYKFVLEAAQTLVIDPGSTGAIIINGAKQADDKQISADDEAESVELISNGLGDWIAFGTIGTWTVEG